MAGDPIQAIMSNLRSAGSIDPGQVTSRQAQMGMDRRQMGMAPPAKAPRDELESVMAQIGADRTTEPDVGVAEGDMKPIISDILNEAIVSMKVEIGREAEEKTRRKLEDFTKDLRRIVMELGGDPVRADEGVDQGIVRLEGHGLIGAERLRQQLGRFPQEQAPPQQVQPQVPIPKPTGVSRTGVSRGRSFTPRRQIGGDWRQLGSSILRPREEV